MDIIGGADMPTKISNGLSTQVSGARPSRRTVLKGFGAASAAAAFASPAIAQAQTLTIWSGYPELEPFYRRVADGMRSSMPNLTVQVQPIPLREHERRIALGLQGGSAADLIEMGNATAQRYVEGGLLAQAPASVANFVRDPNRFDAFFARSASFENNLFGVPLFRGQGALFYNTEMFERAGLTAPPRTMEEYTTYAERLTQRDGTGRPTVTGWSLRLSGGGQGIAEKFWTNMHQYGGALVRQLPNGKWRSDYANEAGRRTLFQYLDNVHTKRTCLMDSPADAEAFQRGQTAMFMRESWVIGDTARKAPNLRYQTAPFPVGTIAVPVLLYTPARGPRTQLAFEFAQAANSPENMVWLLDNVGWLPNRKDVSYAQVIAKTPQLRAFLEFPPGYSFFELPAIGPVDEVLTRCATRLVRAFGDASLAGNTAGIDAFLREAAAETDQILRREGLAP
jgi:multiple sugar transport system substrate-binding protein